MSGAGIFDGAALAAVYRDFAAIDGGARYGSELDPVASTPIHDGDKASLKFARYRNDEYGAPDRTKFWASVGYVVLISAAIDVDSVPGSVGALAGIFSCVAPHARRRGRRRSRVRSPNGRYR